MRVVSTSGGNTPLYVPATESKLTLFSNTAEYSSVYANSRWKCPYCGMELDVFDTFIMDHKQKKCLQEKSTRSSSYEDDVEDAYKKGYEEGLEKGNKDGYDKGYNEASNNEWEEYN